MSNYRRLTTTDEYRTPVIYLPADKDEPILVRKKVSASEYLKSGRTETIFNVVDTYVLSGELVDALYEREESIAKYVYQALNDMSVYLKTKTTADLNHYTISVDDFSCKYNELLERYCKRAAEQDADIPFAKVKRTANIKDFAEQVKKIIHKDENISDSEDEYLCEEIDSLLEEISNTEKSE